MICPHCGKHVDKTREKEYASKRSGREKTAYHDFSFKVEAITAKALCVDDGLGEMWLPKSQIKFNGDIDAIEVGDQIDLQVSDWIAKQKGLLEPEQQQEPDQGPPVEAAAPGSEVKAPGVSSKPGDIPF
jgi:hypothetical protein